MRYYKGYFRDSFKTIIVITKMAPDEIPWHKLGVVFEREINWLAYKTVYHSMDSVRL